MVRTARCRALARPLRSLAILLVVGVWMGTAAAAEVDAWLTRSTTTGDQPVELIIETTGSPQGRPDLSVLDAGFRIVDRRTSSSVTVLNGQRSERYRLVLSLLPLRTGELTIPPIAVGELATAPLSLTVTPARQGETRAPPGVAEGPAGASPTPGAKAQAFLEAQLDDAEAWVEEQVVLSARVMSRGALDDARLHDPEADGARVLPLGEERTTEVRDGQSWQVYERRYALFPGRPGRLEIAPLRFEARSLTGTGPGQSLRALSKALTVDVRSRPVLPSGVSWLPARAVRLTETGDDKRERPLGEPWQRVVTVTAEGLMGEALPALGLNAPFELNARSDAPQVWDERTRDGVIGHRRERIWLTAREPGRYTLPAVRLPWWDTNRGELRYAVLPARAVEVPGRGAGEPEAARAAEDAEVERPEQPSGAQAAGPWPWVAALLALLLVAVFLGRARTHRRAAPEPTPASRKAPAAEPPRDARAEAIAAVRSAYRRAHAAAAREALLAWARQQWPKDPPGNLSRLSIRCPEPLRGQIVLLEKAFFSPEPLPWDQEAVWEGLEAFASPAEQPDPRGSG